MNKPRTPVRPVDRKRWAPGQWIVDSGAAIPAYNDIRGQAGPAVVRADALIRRAMRMGS